MRSEPPITTAAGGWTAQVAAAWASPQLDEVDTVLDGGDEPVAWFQVDLFGAPPTTPGSRFDQTVAVPVDAPQRLDAVIRAAGLRLLALPDPQHLGHRSVAYRARLQQVMREAAQARCRLATGTYGSCLDCDGPISLARLTERPWARSCAGCALDI